MIRNQRSFILFCLCNGYLPRLSQSKRLRICLNFWKKGLSFILNDRVLLDGKEEIMRLRIPLLPLLTLIKEARSLALKNGMEWDEVRMGWSGVRSVPRQWQVSSKKTYSTSLSNPRQETSKIWWWLTPGRGGIADSIIMIINKSHITVLPIVKISVLFCVSEFPIGSSQGLVGRQ
jgi:hypothetical protein